MILLRTTVKYLAFFWWFTGVISLDCGPHGIYYPEDTLLGLTPACECSQCYEGPRCAIKTANCLLDVTTVELTMMREWFSQQQSKLSSNLQYEYHMGYLDQSSGLFAQTNSRTRRDRISGILNSTIRALHRKVGNVEDLDERLLVVGAGAMQLISASMYALCANSPVGKQCPIFTKRPFWGEFEDVSKVHSPRVRWMKSKSDYQPSDVDEIIEIVTNPNNPDGRANVGIFNTTKTIHDSVYNWPSFPTPHTHLDSTDPAIIVFSLSKLSGYAASRVGWALIKNASVAQAIHEHIFLNGQGAGVEAQYRAVRILQSITDSIDTHGEYFAAVRTKMQSRWTRLERAINGSRFSIDGVSGQAFAWLRCHAGDAKVLREGGLRVSNGTGFGAADSDPHVRIVMGVDDSNFDEMIARLTRVIRDIAS